MNHTAILGSGSWGTALAFAASQKSARVTLWGHRQETAAEINATRRNQRYLPGISLPSAIRATTDFRDLAEADLVLAVVPSRALRQVACALKASGQLRPDAILLCCIKGIEMDTGLTMSGLLADIFPDNPLAVLSGPNHAEEIAKKLAAAAVIGSHDEGISLQLQEFFTLPWFRTYRSTDVPGIEWGGAVKNIFAIASGISEGLGLGDNARAALVTRGLAEMTRLGMAAGGRFETFQGLSGVGDLIVTCYSQHSRNNRVGRLLGQGQTLPEIAAAMNMVAEGVPNTESIHAAARRYHIRTPIIDQMYAILYEGKPCAAALTELLSRDPRAEHD
jgi:glycerol-3-phosphate dehydrogenase (NAD(P)+)